MCLSLHYNGANSYLFVYGKEIYEFKAKDSEIMATPACLGNISKGQQIIWKKQGLMDMSMVLVLTAVFFPFSIEASKCSGSCNNINYPYAKICVPDVVKNLNVKVFNLMSRTNERMIHRMAQNV